MIADFKAGPFPRQTNSSVASSWSLPRKLWWCQVAWVLTTGNRVEGVVAGDSRLPEAAKITELMGDSILISCVFVRPTPKKNKLWLIRGVIPPKTVTICDWNGIPPPFKQRAQGFLNLGFLGRQRRYLATPQLCIVPLIKNLGVKF